MKTFREIAAINGQKTSPISLQQLGQTLQLPQPFSLRQSITAGSFYMFPEIRAKWMELGGEKSFLGNPIAELKQIRGIYVKAKAGEVGSYIYGGNYLQFEHGFITYCHNWKADDSVIYVIQGNDPVPPEYYTDAPGEATFVDGTPVHPNQGQPPIVGQTGGGSTGGQPITQYQLNLGVYEFSSNGVTKINSATWTVSGPGFSKQVQANNVSLQSATGTVSIPPIAAGTQLSITCTVDFNFRTYSTTWGFREGSTILDTSQPATYTWGLGTPASANFRIKYEIGYQGGGEFIFLPGWGPD